VVEAVVHIQEMVVQVVQVAEVMAEHLVKLTLLMLHQVLQSQVAELVVVGLQVQVVAVVQVSL
jgi:hypothetical protein